MSTVYFLTGIVFIGLGLLLLGLSPVEQAKPRVVETHGTAANTQLIEETYIWILVYSPDAILKGAPATKAIAGTRSATLKERSNVIANGGKVMRAEVLGYDNEIEDASLPANGNAEEGEK